MNILQDILTATNLGVIGGAGTVTAIVLGVNRNINHRLKQKADKELTEQRFESLNEKINSKADRATVTEIKDNVGVIRSLVEEIYKTGYKR